MAESPLMPEPPSRSRVGARIAPAPSAPVPSLGDSIARKGDKGDTMKTIIKYAAVVAMTGAALAVTAVTPSQARNGRVAAAAIGFGAGALVGAAAANAANAGYYYGPGYYRSGYYGSGYAYQPGYAGYAYQPGYAGYAYVPEPGYVAPSYSYGSGDTTQPSCATDAGYGRYDYSAC
jgi:hypothetical protein